MITKNPDFPNSPIQLEGRNREQRAMNKVPYSVVKNRHQISNESYFRSIPRPKYKRKKNEAYKTCKLDKRPIVDGRKPVNLLRSKDLEKNARKMGVKWGKSHNSNNINFKNISHTSD